MNELPWTFLWYMGRFYGTQFRIYKDQRLCRVLKRLEKSGPRKGKPRLRFYPLRYDRLGDYTYWKIFVDGKQIRIQSHRAVVDSFEHFGKDTSHLVAAHKPGKKRSDGALGDTELVTPAENCAHKKRDGTVPRGHSTAYVGLRAIKDQIGERFKNKESVSKIAKSLYVSRNAINYWLKQLGLKPLRRK